MNICCEWTPLKNSSSDVLFFLYVESFPDWPIRYDLCGHVMTFQIHFCIRFRLPERNSIKPSLSSHFNHSLAVASYHVLLRNISNLRKPEPACTSGSLLSLHLNPIFHLPKKGEGLWNQKVLAFRKPHNGRSRFPSTLGLFWRGCRNWSQNTGSNLSVGKIRIVYSHSLN